MNKRLIVSVLVLGLATAAFSQTAQQIIDRADAAFELERVYSKSTLTVTRDGRAQATQVMETYELGAPDGTSRSLSVFSAPPRVAGTAYLMIGDDLWVRFASTGRIRKLSSSAKQNSAAGSDFSYADMGDGSSSFTEDYSVALDGDDRVRGENCWRLVLSPMGGDDLYEKLVVWVAQEGYRYLRIEFHEDGAAVKVMDLEDYRDVGRAAYPYRVTMRSLVQDSESVILIETIEAGSPRVQERFFSQSYLRTIR
jgi:hypothetical protein